MRIDGFGYQLFRVHSRVNFDAMKELETGPIFLSVYDINGGDYRDSWAFDTDDFLVELEV